METPQNAAAAKELLVTGVSRSGRVRKKSSKLLDFQSPDEVEKKPTKRLAKPTRLSNIGRSRPPNAAESSYHSMRARRSLGVAGTADDLAGDDEHLLEDEFDTDAEAQFGDGSMLAADSSDDGLDELVADLVGGVEAESVEHSNNGESGVRQSLYMTEKANKRKMLKDGKVVTGKLERKDKGKSRYTAYSLWAREFRKTSKFSKNQDLDFSSTARRLGELWANVSNKEKSAWRRKAKIQATKAKARDKEVAAAATTAMLATAASNASFFNRATTSRTRKLAEERSRELHEFKHNNFPKMSPTVPKRKRNNSYKLTNNAATASSNTEAGKPTHTKTNNNHVSNLTSNTNSQSTHSKTGIPNIEAIDAAAHLKLLGESLTIIGERLKEHEGQIAVSGSLSVLLDSLLCSLGPLLCLTTHIPGLEKKSKLSENLASTLDNIAYVMPGL